MQLLSSTSLTPSGTVGLVSVSVFSSTATPSYIALTVSLVPGQPFPGIAPSAAEVTRTGADITRQFSVSLLFFQIALSACHCNIQSCVLRCSTLDRSRPNPASSLADTLIVPPSSTHVQGQEESVRGIMLQYHNSPEQPPQGEWKASWQNEANGG